MNVNFTHIRKRWKDLSVSHKLYCVVGLMALLITVELFVMYFTIETLSSVRAFVAGEGVWSKSQKNALIEIQNYIRTYDEKHYRAFKDHMQVIESDRQARLEIMKPDMDLELAHENLLKGKNHPQDVQGMVHLLRRFQQTPYIKNALYTWERGDHLVSEISDLCDQIHVLIKTGHGKPDKNKIQTIVEKIFVLNNKLTDVENKFSQDLGEASNTLKNILIVAIAFMILLIEGFGLFLTIQFAHVLKKSLKELQVFANEVGDGDFTKTVRVHSADELGQLAVALNKMTSKLKNVSNEQHIAEQANSIKSLFLANMSHEIRTPLNAILGFVSLLKNQDLSKDEELRYLEIIERAGFSLTTIINDILDISKVEAGKLEIEKANCSLNQLIKDLELLFSLRCQEKGIDLKFNKKSLPDEVVTDPTRLKQILINIIGNAVKFTNRGGVYVMFYMDGDRLICKIEDTGIGVSSENVKKLFQPFSQVDLSIRKKFGGTGLGLVMSKRLAQLLNGDVILVKSQVSQGSTFLVSVKVGYVAEKTLPPKPHITLSKDVYPLMGKKILVADDSIDNQLLALQYLKKAGASVMIVNHGQEAIDATSKDEYDLILMDMQMPVMDGYTATTQLRKMGYHAPIVALTAHAMKEDLDKCLSAGCTDYLSKPFRGERLTAMAAQYCRTAS